MQTQTEKLTQKQTESLIGVNELNELGIKVQGHPDLKIKKLTTRLIPIVGGNAFYAHSVKITNVRTGDFWMSVTHADAHEFIDAQIVLA